MTDKTSCLELPDSSASESLTMPTYADLKTEWASALPERFVRDGFECLRILGAPVMESWEEPYMITLSQVACQNGGRILEVGFGLGISAKYIDENAAVSEHVIIEANQEVAQRARAFAASARVKTVILEGFWQDVVPSLVDASFNGIIFDVFPLTKDEVVVGEVESFFPPASRLLRPGGAFTFYYDVAAGWLATMRAFRGDTSTKLRAAGFTCVDDDEVLCTAPPNCEYFWKDRFLVPRVFK